MVTNVTSAQKDLVMYLVPSQGDNARALAVQITPPSHIKGQPGGRLGHPAPLSNSHTISWHIYSAIYSHLGPRQSLSEFIQINGFTNTPPAWEILAVIYARALWERIVCRYYHCDIFIEFLNGIGVQSPL